MENLKKLSNLLPGFNCSSCGYKRCDEFASALIEKDLNITLCPFISQPQFEQNKEKIETLICQKSDPKEAVVKGLIDKVEADFKLFPLDNEHSCREVLVSFSNTVLYVNDIIRYRPLGCPIIHFAEILSIDHGLITVHIIGPCKRLNPNEKAEIKDLGVCMVLSFTGKIVGKLPAVGQTVKFLPNHCMMGKIHSGIIVNIEKEIATIDCIDLKVWEHCKT